MLCSKGYNISERRISQSLIRVAPESYEQRRQDTHDKLNPIPYVARYYGHKLHIDQNEKLMQFGVVHVLARDGYSGKIVSFSTMPVKNNIFIYESVYIGKLSRNILNIQECLPFIWPVGSIKG